MKTRGETIGEIIAALKPVGFDVDKIEFKAAGNPRDPSIVEIEIKLSNWNHHER